MASNYIDPAFQIGMMLGDAYGNMWAANARKRQGAKADDIIEQMQNQRAIQRIADARRAGISDEDAVQVITNKIAQQAGAQGATQATGMGQLNQPSIDFMGMGAQMAEPQDPYKLSVPSPLDQLKGAGGKEYSINKALQANQNALNKEKEAQTVLASNPTAQAAYNWNPDYTEDNVRKALRKAGLAKDVIDEKVGEVKSDIAKRAEAVLLPSIQKKMFYGYDTVEKDEDGNKQEYAGNRFRLTPKNSFTIGAYLDFPVGSNSNIFFRPTYTYKSKVFFEEDNNPDFTQDGYGLCNFTLGWRYQPKKVHYEISAFGKNIFDEKYIIDAGNSGRQIGFPTYVGGSRSVIGAQFKIGF